MSQAGGWHSLHLDHKQNPDCSNSWTIYVSPEVYEFLCLEAADFLELKWDYNNTLSGPRNVFKVRPCGSVRKNCVALHPSFRTRRKTVRIRRRNPCASLPSLTSVTLIGGKRSAFEDGEIQEALKELPRGWLSAGREYFSGSQFRFRLSSSEPFSTGLITDETKIKFKAPKFSAPEENALGLVRLCSRLILPGLEGAQKEDLLSSLSGTFKIREVPMGFARCVARIHTEKDMNLSSTCFTNCSNWNLEEDLTICQLKSRATENYLVLPLVPSFDLPENKTLYVTRGLLQYLKSKFSPNLDEDSFQVNILRGQPEFDKENPQNEKALEIPTAKKVEIAFFGTHGYADLNSKCIDALLKAYFAEPKYIFTGQAVEVPLRVYLPREKDILNSVSLKDGDATVFFRVLSVDCQHDSRLGAFASATETSLFQKMFVQDCIPSRYFRRLHISRFFFLFSSSSSYYFNSLLFLTISSSVSWNPGTTEIHDDLPPMLSRLSDRLVGSLKDSSSVLLLGQHWESGADLLLEKTALRLGINLSVVNCSLLFAETSGITETRVKQSFAKGNSRLFELPTNRRGQMVLLRKC